ncbi:MAG: hypothetical protein HQL36_10905, partial [Alphaproteobacteria bacterium]|nr:hypothetical protein [Alphaproteobacteria bacterium]
MFGKRGTGGPGITPPKGFGGGQKVEPKEPKPAPSPAPGPAAASKPAAQEPKKAAPPPKPKTPAKPESQAAPKLSAEAKEKLDEIKVNVFNDLMEAVDLAELSSLTPDQVREEITDMVS